MSTLDRLLQLNAQSQPGLTEVEFRKLLARCQCGLIMMNRAFRRHECAQIAVVQHRVIIDLTSDTDENSQSNIINLTLDSDN